ncbi:MAG: helix-turn-helix transcriptional regulator [Treponema sp.]|jgi:predicted transcriptional regulator YheO|nr:helix-turn-helix transcriptional regulator [Treponema sp.]
MKSIHEQQELFDKVMTLLERHLGPKCEVVLHDLTRDYGSTIVDIRNGHITNRRTGDSGSNLGLEVLRGTLQDGDQFNYITYTRDNKVLRSSSIYIHGEEGRVIGAICLNLDITQSLLCEEFLHQFNQFPLENIKKEAEDSRGDRADPCRSGDSSRTSDQDPGEAPVKEIFVNSVRELLDYLIGEALAQAGKTVSQMRLADKLQFVRFLDQKGAFLITHSGDVVCEFLNISKYSLYRYLEIVRGKEQT